MILNRRWERLVAWFDRREKWSHWFAWHPVYVYDPKTNGHGWRWLEWVWRVGYREGLWPGSWSYSTVPWPADRYAKYLTRAGKPGRWIAKSLWEIW